MNWINNLFYMGLFTALTGSIAFAVYAVVAGVLDGNLKHTYPDEEVEKAKYDEVAQVLLEGIIYELTLQSGVYTFIIDGTNDRTYALKVTGSGDTQEWNRFLEV